MKWQSSFPYLLYITLITRQQINHILRMACIFFSVIIYGIVLLCCVRLKFMVIDIFRTGEISVIFRFKDTKTREKLTPIGISAGAGLPTSSCPAIAVLSCQDSTTSLGRFPSPSLGKPTKPADCFSLVQNWQLLAFY